MKKIKKDFLAREVAGQLIVVAVNETSIHFNKMLKLNESSAILWNQLMDGATMEDLVHALLDEYELDEAQARAGVQNFLDTLNELEILEDVSTP